VHPGRETLMHYFSCLGGPIEVSIKSARLHVMPNLCFCILSDLWVTQCIRGMKCPRIIFHAQVGLLQIPQKAHRDTLCQTCVFASFGIYMSHSAFRCIQARNVHAIFLLLEWDRYLFHKKRAGTRYAKLVFLHLVGYAGPVVDSGAFGA
jgi:hypothetical protein